MRAPLPRPALPRTPRWLGMLLLTLCAALGSSLAGAACPQQTPALGDAQFRTASGSRFMAATANPHATMAACRILEAGGSAVDAALAAQLVLGLVEPQASGIGGGGFMLYWDAEQSQLHFLDGRETAPAGAGEDLFLDEQGQPLEHWEAVVGGRAVGVPGLLAMLKVAHQRFGRLPWEENFHSAIRLAEDGFRVSERLSQMAQYVPRMSDREALRNYLFDATGAVLPAGAPLRNPAYANTLRRIAQEGLAAFYQGSVAQAMVAAVREDPNPGTLSAKDLLSYRVRVRTPLCGHYRNYRVCGPGPPSSGGVTVLAILGIMEHLNSQAEPDSAQFLHLFAQASRLAYADRDHYLGDTDFVKAPIHGLIDRQYLARRAALISPTHATDASPGKPPGVTSIPPAAPPSHEGNSTTHLSVVDRYGNALSMTSTIEGPFGARLMVEGFLLNNQLTDFHFQPRDANGALHANSVAPGKRPRSSTSPIIVFQGNTPILLIGSPGGNNIIAYVARTLLWHLGAKRPLHEAIAAPHLVARTPQLWLEQGAFPPQIIKDLQDRGHQLLERRLTSGLHGIVLGPTLQGAADPRREGAVLGD